MKTTAYKLDLLKHVFQNTTLALIGDAAGLLASATPGSLYLSAHTAFPGLAGTQLTSESAYTGYARKAVARNATKWPAVGGDHIENGEEEALPASTSGPETILYIGIGTDSSGAGKLLYMVPAGAVQLGVGTGALDDLVTSPGHGLSAGDRVAFFGGTGLTLPTGVTEGTVYHVIAGGLTTDAFKFSTTAGGGALDMTAVGEMIVVQCSPLVVNSGITPTFAANAIAIYED